MKKILVIALLICCSATVIAENKKIAVIDMQKLIKTSLETEHIKKMSSDLKSEKERLTQELEARKTHLREIQKNYMQAKSQYDDLSVVATDEERKVLITKLQRYKEQYEKAYELARLLDQTNLEVELFNRLLTFRDLQDIDN